MLRRPAAPVAPGVPCRIPYRGWGDHPHRALVCCVALVGCGGGEFIAGPTQNPPPDAADDQTVGPDASVDARSSDGLATMQDADALPGQDASEQPPPHCSGGFTCSPVVPAGWSGPLELAAGTSNAAACSAHFVGPMFQGNSGLTGVPATCDCQCEPPTGVQCSQPTLSFYGGAAPCSPQSPCLCSTSQHCADVDVAEGACTPVDVTAKCGIGAAIEFADSTPNGGACAPLATTAVSPPSWATHASACTSAIGQAPSDCPADSVCTPSAAAPFDAKLCIAQSGDVPCPASGYSAKRLFYGDVSDMRTCEACSCSGPTNVSCSAGFAFYPAGSACAGAGAISYTSSGSCTPAEPTANVELTVKLTGGACTPSTVAPTGELKPADPTTFCCLE